jgi:cytochrome c oxidase cbb3-type subunit 2
LPAVACSITRKPLNLKPGEPEPPFLTPARCLKASDDGQAPGLKDDWGFPIVPANLTRGLFKSGPGVSDIFRTITTGLSGTPMPSYSDAFPEADRWALAYYILSLSAYTDPLTGAPLPIAPAARAALDDPKLETAGPGQAYGLPHPCAGVACAVAGLSPGPASGAGR